MSELPSTGRRTGSGLDGAAGAAAHADAGAVLPAWSRSIRRGMAKSCSRRTNSTWRGGTGPISALTPPATLDAYVAWLRKMTAGDDPLFHAIVDQAHRQAGRRGDLSCASTARNGVIEVGNINYSPLLQRKPAATEAMFLMMARVFDELGYRRYEWKCDSLNAPSRAAAARLGFQYEGLFRQAVVYKGRNRDTCWFSIIDSEWPALKRAYEQWLAAENFDAGGRQRRGLAELIVAAR